jgi:molybdopterin molybdotransferase
MTGAPIPRGHDAVVKLEEVTTIRNDQATLASVALPTVCEGSHVRPAGADFRPGAPVITRGETIRTPHVLALAALGVPTVRVARAPKIAIIATGGELAPLGQTPVLGQIRNATSPYLRAALRTFNAEVTLSPVARDDAHLFRDTLVQQLESEPDLVITTGAVSMGIHDFVPSVVAGLGGDILFHRAAIRPGGPILGAVLSGGIPLFGLPGNPVSTVTGMRFFVAPYLRRWLGMKDEVATRARLTETVQKPGGLCCFFKSTITHTADGDTTITVLPGQASFLIHPLLDANAWAVLPQSGDSISAGTLVDTFPLDA